MSSWSWRFVGRTSHKVVNVKKNEYIREEIQHLSILMFGAWDRLFGG